MAKPTRRLVLPDAVRKQAIGALQTYFRENMDDPIGDLKAGLLLDFIVSELGPSIYNQAIADARTFIDERASDLAAICYHDEFPASSRRRTNP